MADSLRWSSHEKWIILDHHLYHGHWLYIQSSPVIGDFSEPVLKSPGCKCTNDAKWSCISGPLWSRSKRCLWLGLEWFRPWWGAAICFKKLPNFTFGVGFPEHCLWNHLGNLLVWSVYGVLMCNWVSWIYMFIIDMALFTIWYHLISYVHMSWFYICVHNCTVASNCIYIVLY